MPRKASRTDYQSLINVKTKLISRIRNLNPTLANDISDLRLDWYRVRNAADGGGATDTTEIFIYDEIGGWFGFPVEDFVKELNDIKTPKIDVRINSPGGSLFDSIAIYNALVKHPAKVTTYVDALAASGASIIAMAGDETVMMVGSQLMIHDALGVELGNAADMRAMAEFLDKQSDNIATVYAHKAGDATDWRALMLAETWMFADEAITLGLADRLYSAPTVPEEEEPDGDEPEEGEPEPEEDAEDAEGDDEEEPDEDVEALMHRTHRLTNRGYKFAGREKAPAPPVDDWSSSIANFVSKVRK